MTKRDDGGPAFSGQSTQYSLSGKVVGHQSETGMSLRDWFAGQAMAGVATRQNFHAIEHAAARQAYAIADAMLEERKK